MTGKLLRLFYVCEFLLAIVAIFTAWPEIGGQGAWDLMHWGWKLGLGFALSLAVAAFTASLVAADAWFTLRTARWMAAMVVLLLGMGAITYYYSLQEDEGDADDSSVISRLVSGQGVNVLRLC